MRLGRKEGYLIDGRCKRKKQPRSSLPHFDTKWAPKKEEKKGGKCGLAVMTSLDDHAFATVRMRIVRSASLVPGWGVSDTVANRSGCATCSGGLSRVRLLTEQDRVSTREM